MKKLMQSIINKQQNGFIPLSLPTGSGKSYNAVEVLYEALLDQNDKRHYFYLTPSIKNKLYDDLKNKCEREGKMDIFNEKVFDLKSNQDMLFDNFGKIDKRETEKIPELKSSFGDLNKVMEREFTLRKYGDSDRDAVNRADAKFRKDLHTILKKEIGSKGKINEAIQENGSAWSWVGEMYPGYAIKQKKIIFMSVAKYIYQYDSIIESPFLFYRDKDFKGSVILLDESDSAKQAMLKAFVDNDSSYSRIRLVELFRMILHAVNRDVNSFPKSMFQPSSTRINNTKYNPDSLKDLVEALRKRANEIDEQFRLCYELKTDDKVISSQSLIFHDPINSITLGNEDKKPVVIPNEELHVNQISYQEGKNHIHLTYLLNAIENFIVRFMRDCMTLAINYQQCKREQGTNSYELVDAINSVFSAFHIGGEFVSYLRNEMLFGNIGSSKKLSEGIGKGFYQEGFSLHTIEDEYAHDLNSVVFGEKHEETPEKILLEMAQKSLVIGLSATADVPSCIRNFDLGYLRSELKNNYLEVSPETFSQLKEWYDAKNEGYKNIDIKIHFSKVFEGNCEEECWTYLFGDGYNDDLAKEMIEEINSRCSNFSDRQHLFNLTYAFDKFIENPDICSFLCVMNTFFKKHIEDVFFVFEMLVQKHRKVDEEIIDSIDVRNQVFILDGEDFEGNKSKILTKLSSGERQFVISTYQTIATGQNLQYPAPECLFADGRLVWTNERINEDKKKDFDAIYLERPSNILTNINNGQIKMVDKVMAMYECEFLKETGEISNYAMKKRMEHIAKSGKSEENVNLYDTRSVKNGSMIQIIQAIGRIGRTNLKNRNVYIFADGSIPKKCMTDSLVQTKRLYSPEVRKFLDAAFVRMENHESETDQEYINRAVNKSKLLNKDLSEFLGKRFSTDDDIIFWEKIRENLLKDPQGINGDVSRFYIELPEASDHYYYKQKADFLDVEISFKNSFDSGSTVSAETVRLEALMKNRELRDFMEANGYATSFVPSKWMMAPVVANNLYKGALGEAIGKYLVEKYANIKLEDIRNLDLYEKFDYKVSEQKIYFDFKNWSENTRFDQDVYMKKIIKKAKECDASLVVIPNLLSSSDYRSNETDVDGIHVLEVPQLVKLTERGTEIDFKMIDLIEVVCRRYENGLSD